MLFTSSLTPPTSEPVLTMSFISIFRIVALSLSLCLGLIVLGLTGHWLELTIVIASKVLDFEIAAIIAGVLALLLLPLMLVVGLIRRGAFTSMIAVELPVLTILWCLFLAVGALAAQWKDLLFPLGCGDLRLFGPEQGWCREFFAIMGCSFVIWIILLLYTVTLLVVALIAKSRGHRVWTVSVQEANFFDKPAGEFGGALTQFPAAAAYPVTPAQQYPMAQQYTAPGPVHSGLPQV